MKILKAISNPVRLKILRFLCKKPSCVTLTNEVIKISQPNLSQHLKILKDSGIISSRKDKNRRCYYIVDPDPLKQLIGLLDQIEGSIEEIEEETE
jgi:ArsR family transcriptional regulator